MWHNQGCPLRKPSRYAKILTREIDGTKGQMIYDVEAMRELHKVCWVERPYYEERAEHKEGGLTISEMVPRGVSVPKRL